MHEIWPIVLSKSLKLCHQMSDFKAKMDQIRCSAGAPPQTCWGSSQRSPNPIAGLDLRGPTSKRGGKGEKGGGSGGKGEGRCGNGRDGVGVDGGVRKGKERGEGGKGEGKEACPTNKKIVPAPLFISHNNMR